MTVQNGDVQDDWGGAIYVSNGSLTLNRVRFLNNRADNGGAVYITFGGLTVQDCEFVENFAAFAGGGIYADSAKATVRNSKFINNTTDARGAAISSEGVTLVIEDSFFLKNVSKGNRGGALHLEHVNVNIARSQFYQNQSEWIGGAIYINNPVMSGTSDDEGNPLDQLDESPTYIQMATLIPGYEATLEAHPSGVFQDFHEDIQIHENCFANNIIVDAYEMNFSSAILARAANAENNYFGNSSGPSGGGPGTGDGVGRKLNFAPFLTEPPSFCDPELSKQVTENHNQ
jgi:predicted outer membrane repeat protein